MDILNFLNNEELRVLMAQPMTTTEKAVAAKIQAEGGWNGALSTLRSELGKVSVGLIVGAMGEASDAHQVLAKVLVKGSMNNVIEMANQMVVDYEIERMMQEGGILHGIESEEEILRRIADYYAEQAAKESAYYRFNTQGGGATAITIDLKTLPYLKGKKTDDIVVKYKRADIMPSECGVQPDRWLELEREPWPASRYAKEETLNKYLVLDGRRVKVLNGKKLEVMRPELHLRITARLDETINPTLMVEEKEYDLTPTYPLAMGTMVPSVYRLGLLSEDVRFNSQATVGAVASANLVGTEQQQPTTEQPKAETKEQQSTATASDEGLSFPIVKEKCKLANGNYKCPRCGNEGLRKKDLMAWQMKKLPAGVNTGDYAEQVKWSGSCICGTCRDALKNEQEQKLAAVTAYEKAVAEWEQAEDEVATAKAKEQQLEDNIKTLKDAGQSTEVLEGTLESLRLNTQKAEAHATELLAKVDSLDPNNNTKSEELKAEEPEVKEPEQQQPQQQSASANAKAGVTNVRTKKGGRKGRK